jgi:hypothetical protein
MTSNWQVLDPAMTAVRDKVSVAAPGLLRVEKDPRTMEMMIVHNSSMNTIGWQRRYVSIIEVRLVDNQ